MNDPLSLTPIWVTGLLLFAAMLAAALFGRWLHLRDSELEAAHKLAASAEGQSDYVVAAITGLLALLLGFTFSLAIDRFETRRLLVLDEANAIARTYLRSQLLEEPHRGRMTGLLVAFVDNRVALGAERRPVGSPLYGEGERLITDLWTATAAAFPSIKDLDFSSTFVDGVNEIIDVDSSRKAARYARVPTIVYVVLIIYEIGTAGVLGYTLIGRRGRVVSAVLVFLFGTSLLLIVDIDRPTIGTVRESQAPMIWLEETLATWPPQVFDRWSDGTGAD